MFQATRRRLALWYTTVTAVLLLIFASGFYWYVRDTLVERVDDTLNHVAEVVERSLVIEPGEMPGDFTPSFQVNVDASFRASGEAVDDDHIDLEWFSAEGELLWTTLEHPLNISLHVNPYGETVHQNETLVLRQITQRIQRGRQVLGYLRVSHPWFEVTKPTQTLMVDLIFGTILTIGTVAAIGWFLSGLAMAPVRDSYQRLKQFTADASHELRNPIAVLQTNVQVALADPNPDPAMQQAQFRIVERITRRLGRLVDDLLFLARQDSGIVQLGTNPISLVGVVQEVVDEQTAIATLQEINLTFTASPDASSSEKMASADGSLSPVSSPLHSVSSPLHLVEGDRNQLVRLFTNLISNAIQYTPAGGTIDIAVHLHSSQTKRHAQKGVEVQIKDTGIGIPSDELPHIFERFYQVDPARSSLRRPSPSGSSTMTAPASSGSGLGLAIARVIVENHKGQISITSQPDSGTTVSVILPLTPLTPSSPSS